ncbi:MAG: NAD(P)H-dependent oxidoreductase [Elusimicrobiales bacterium]|nr:NAD(P)H-dependent oxidoreductase [Elusimicrobiales bacterium]
MKNMRENTITVVAVPFTFSENPLCPLEQLSLDTLRFITFLKQQKKEVSFINMRSKERYLWRKLSGGRSGRKQIPFFIAAKPLKTFNEKLLSYNPSEVLLWCDFPLSPYLFDMDVIKTLIEASKETVPNADIKLGGSFFRLFPKEAAKLGLELYSADISKIHNCQPDLDASLDENYGLFQISDGCSNHCSFCVAGQSPLYLFDNKKTISYLKKLSAAGINDFWTLDQNILMRPEHAIDFIRKFKNSGIKGKLNFSLGFQPDKINDNLLDELAKINIGIMTVPFETGTINALGTIGKPYTIISSIKALARIRKKCRNNIDRLLCSFVIGYPKDDIQSIFRIFVSVLRLGGAPLPFPLYVFPNTKVYQDNFLELKDKEITELHGQLWPLLPENRIPVYDKLLHFLRIDSLDRAIRAAPFLLSEEMLSVFKQELKINEFFIEQCLASEQENMQALSAIEHKIDEDKNLKLPSLLHIAVSPRLSGSSVSGSMGDFLCNKWKQKNKNGQVNRLELANEPLSFINEEYTKFIHGNVSEKALSNDTLNLVRLTDRWIPMLRKADAIVISLPMYTLSIPASLKCFFELIASRLYYHLRDKLIKKPVCCVISREGTYSEHSEMHSVQEISLSTALSFIGLTDNPMFVISQGYPYSPNGRVLDKKLKKELAGAAANISEEITSFLSAAVDAKRR